MRKGQKSQAQTAFNIYWLIYLFAFAFALWGIAYLLIEEGRVSWFLLLLGVISLFLLCADAVYYRFTKTEMILVHFWGRKQILPWFYVHNIAEMGFWGSFHHGPHYSVNYKKFYKGKTIILNLIMPKTRRIQKCLHIYYPTNIFYEDKPRKKE